MLIFVTLKSIDKAMMLSLQQLKATEEERDTERHRRQWE